MKKSFVNQTIFFFCILIFSTAIFAATSTWKTDYNARTEEHNLMSSAVAGSGNTAKMQKWLWKMKRANNKILICERVSKKHSKFWDEGRDCPCKKGYEIIVAKLCIMVNNVPAHFTDPERLKNLKKYFKT
jgi:hypothetical protein